MTALEYTSFDTFVDECIAPRPIYYKSPKTNKEYIIMSIDIYDEIEGGIYFYDIDLKDFKLISKYPSKFQPDSHGMALDENNFDLYIFGGTTNNFCFGIFNLLTNKWTIKDYKQQIRKTLTYPQSVVIANGDLYIHCY